MAKTSLVSSSVLYNGGTLAYQAPELYTRKKRFTKKCDVFSAGVIFLELISLSRPTSLYEKLWPSIIGQGLVMAMEDCLKLCLDADPTNRGSFQQLYEILIANKESISTQSVDLEILDIMNDPYAGQISSQRMG